MEIDSSGNFSGEDDHDDVIVIKMIMTTSPVDTTDVFFFNFISHYNTPRPDLGLHPQAIAVFVLGLSQQPSDSGIMPEPTGTVLSFQKTKTKKGSCKNTKIFLDVYVVPYFH